MAREKKSRGSEAKLARLHSLRSETATQETTAALRVFLADRSSLVVAEAVKIAREQARSELTSDLAKAFDRFMTDAEESDPQCRAKIEIVDSLNQLEYADSQVFLRGLTHQQNPRFGNPAGQDAAGALRAHCAIGLARLNHPGVVLLLTELLLDSDNTARAGAARALGGTGSLAAIPLLRYKVRTGDALVEVIGECFSSLLNLSFAESLPFVARFLRARDRDLQGITAFALSETRRPEACTVLTDYWPAAPAELHESLLTALAMFRLPAANDFLIGLIAANNPSAKLALIALAIHRHNPKITTDIAAAVERSGSASLSDLFTQKFSSQ